MPSPLPMSPTLPPGFMLPRPAAADDLPLHGVTILVVEDSRYACEALRLICHRAGARLRRAESLAMARAHLRVYRPDVVIVDLGLPDGRGESLIADLAIAPQRPIAILGTSGNPDGRDAALQAGAEGFLDKPFESFASFCAAIRSHLPGLGPSAVAEARINPDPLALHDDLSRAASVLAAGPDATGRRYLTGFLLGLAHHSHDAALARAATLHGGGNIEALRALLDSRLRHGRLGTAFAAKSDSA